MVLLDDLSAGTGSWRALSQILTGSTRAVLSGGFSGMPGYLVRIRVSSTSELPIGLFPRRERISLRGCIVAPGSSICIITSFNRSHERCFARRNLPCCPWLLALYPVWVHLNPAAMEAATRLAAAELLLSGCTTSVDHSYLVPDNNHEFLEKELAAARAVGRACVWLSALPHA